MVVFQQMRGYNWGQSFSFSQPVCNGEPLWASCCAGWMLVFIPTVNPVVICMFGCGEATSVWMLSHSGIVDGSDYTGDGVFQWRCSAHSAVFQIRDMAYYLVILFIVVTSFGVVRQAIVFQDDDSVTWSRTLRNVWFYPYWMIYGELFADEIDRTFQASYCCFIGCRISAISVHP